MNLLSRLLCLAGIHGPVIFGNPSVWRSSMSAPFERTCGACGKKWYGREVETPYTRTVGDWKTEKRLRKDGLWNEGLK